MFDGITASALPAGAAMVAGYVDGSWPDAPALASRFPHALLVRIAVSASTNAGVVLDVEKGDATPEEAVNWVLMRRHAGADPSVYCGEAAWASVRAAFQTHDVPAPHWWVAQYDGVAVLPAGAVAKQFKNTPGWDESVVADYWPGVDPAPRPSPASAPIHQLEENEMASTYFDVPTDATGKTRAIFEQIGDKFYAEVPKAEDWSALQKHGATASVMSWEFHEQRLKLFGATAA